MVVIATHSMVTAATICFHYLLIITSCHLGELIVWKKFIPTPIRFQWWLLTAKRSWIFIIRRSINTYERHHSPTKSSRSKLERLKEQVPWPTSNQLNGFPNILICNCVKTTTSEVYKFSCLKTLYELSKWF